MWKDNYFENRRCRCLHVYHLHHIWNDFQCIWPNYQCILIGHIWQRTNLSKLHWYSKTQHRSSATKVLLFIFDWVRVSLTPAIYSKFAHAMASDFREKFAPQFRWRFIFEWHVEYARISIYHVSMSKPSYIALIFRLLSITYAVSSNHMHTTREKMKKRLISLLSSQSFLLRSFTLHKIHSLFSHFSFI